MNAREWLEQATAGMPEPVRDRIQAETLAHLEDAGVGEGADVRAVLGEPKAMRRELGRLYIPAGRLGVLRREPPHLSTFGYFLLLLATYLLPVAQLCLLLQDLRSEGDWGQGELLSRSIWILLLFWLVGLLLAGRLSSERRRLWQEQLSMSTLLTGLGLGLLLDLLRGDPLDVVRLILLILMPIVLCRSIWRARHEDQRLRRTLALTDSSGGHVGGRA